MEKHDKSNEKLNDGLSLRAIHLWLIIVTVIVSVILIFFTYRLTSNFMNLVSATEETIKLEEAAHELMEASDYLTERVQRYTVDGDMRFLEEYFAEAEESKRREEAIAIMEGTPEADAAVKQLQQALSESVALMDREYYAMRLVIEAKGYTDYPDILKDVELSSEDAALSPEDKMFKATKMVLDEGYYEQKDKIRADMKSSLEEIKKLTSEKEKSELSTLNKELNTVRAIILVLVLTILFMVWLTTRIGIQPILSSVDRIKDDSPIPETGAKEFRYLAQAYNKMYAMYKNSIEHLNYKASHDELTGAFNRAGYEMLIDTMDFDSTYMILFDIDDFKMINDTYGHETGDRVLVKLVNALKNNFRVDDYVCRLGGDEIVVFMVHSGDAQKEMIASKIEKINRELKDPDDGLPPFTISAGIVHGTDARDVSELFEKTDAAMYDSKKHGKNRYTFYSENGRSEEHGHTDRNSKNG